MKTTIRSLGSLGAAIVAAASQRSDALRPAPQSSELTAPNHRPATGQVINPKRREKRALMREHGVTSGRQWKRLRQQLKREARAVEQPVEMGAAA